MFNYFYEKKIMIIVPHEDDELNLVGGLLSNKYFNPENIWIVFTTNGDYLCNYKARIREAHKVAKKLHIPSDNLVFLGYADQHIKEQSHIYITHEPDILISKKGNNKTFGPKKYDEFHFKRYNEHSKFNYEFLLQDFIDVISLYEPEVIFVNDFDSHPDHRASSLIFDKSMGIILKEKKDYYPLIYKGFAYPTAYKGVQDFNEINIYSTKFLTEPFSLSEMQNPFYTWNERVRFPVSQKRLLILNLWYQLLKKYKSQLIIRKSFSIINSDMIFFQRSSHNLCLNAKIEVSSGNSEYINDFMLFDISSIGNGDCKVPTLGNKAWIPDVIDSEKKITIAFEKKSRINKIIFYQNLYDESKIDCLKIELSNEEEMQLKLNRTKTIMEINSTDEIEWIRIYVVSSVGQNAGLSEIEVLSYQKSIFEYFDVEINQVFSPQKIYMESLQKALDIKFYYYNGIETKILDKNNILINSKPFSNDKLCFGHNHFTYNNSNFSKKVLILKFTKIRQLFNYIIVCLNKCILKTDIFVGRLFNKINRLIKRL